MNQTVLSISNLIFTVLLVKIKASYASKDDVSHAKFWNSALFSDHAQRCVYMVKKQNGGMKL